MVIGFKSMGPVFYDLLKQIIGLGIYMTCARNPSFSKLEKKRCTKRATPVDVFFRKQEQLIIACVQKYFAISCRGRTRCLFYILIYAV